MVKDPKLFLKHILGGVGQIEEYVRDISKEKFLASPQIQDAVMRRLAIIGEATKNLPSDLREKYAQIPWNNIAGMRDMLIHEYFGVDMELVWNTIQKDLPVFKAHVENILITLKGL
ncbi:MAG: DUF86 domain-containing protein [Candidatus Sungbacteria bacterium]|nr:DUF86 domain-containing protein [Candidatus Sungbacteria bacterium]